MFFRLIFESWDLTFFILRDCLKRAHILSQAFLKQRNYEAKYNIDLVQDPETGKTSFVDRPKDEASRFQIPNLMMFYFVVCNTNYKLCMTEIGLHF